MAKVFIGTSGWQYAHWRGNFYPSNLAYKDWLKYYSQYFESVEVNSSFYRQIRKSTYEKWLSAVSPDFTFSIKGNRFITHIKRLRDCEEVVEKFFQEAGVLAKKQKNKNVVLWQLPPSLKFDEKKLTDFIKLLPKSFRHAFEFRNNSFLNKDIFRILCKSLPEVTLVFQDWKEWPVMEDYLKLVKEAEILRLPFFYIRFHGKSMLYTSSYSEELLAQWAEKMQKYKSKGLDVYAYFNNDALGYAVSNSQTLKNLI